MQGTRYILVFSDSTSILGKTSKGGNRGSESYLKEMLPTAKLVTEVHTGAAMLRLTVAFEEMTGRARGTLS